MTVEIFVTTGEIGDSYSIVGIVSGVSVLAGNVLKDTRENLRNLTGGDMVHYSALIQRSFDLAQERMKEQATALDADGIIAMRCQSIALTEGAAEILCYGTAIRFMS